VSDQLGIVELGDVCAAMRAHSLELFAQLGAWVTTTAPGELQRLFAEACHRHAWHAELWELRTPAIPRERAPSAPPPERSEVEGDEIRRERFRAELSTLEDELRGLRTRIDPRSIRARRARSISSGATSWRSPPTSTRYEPGDASFAGRAAKGCTAGCRHPNRSAMPCGGQWSSRL
jgi:hypothetical protein